MSAASHSTYCIFACIVSKLRYCLQAIWPNKVSRHEADAFYARCLRRILGIAPSSWSCGNSAVLQRARAPKLSKTLLEQQLHFFGVLAWLLVEHTFCFLFSRLGPEPSSLAPDPSQTLNYRLQFRSVKFSASGVSQVSRSKISNTQDWVYFVHTKQIGSQAFNFGSRPTPKA